MIDLFRLRGEDEFRDLDGSHAPEVHVPGVSDAAEFPRVSLWTPPGPIAAAFFACDADIAGIRGPVGSGKTTAHLRSRIRRAQRMPRSGSDGVRRYIAKDLSAAEQIEFDFFACRARFLPELCSQHLFVLTQGANLR